MKSKPILLAIGDSHCKFWRGVDSQKPYSQSLLPNVKVLHLGPVTAHNINRPGSSSGGKEKLIAHLENFGQLYDGFIVCMGEIDCRAHIIRVALNDRTSIERAVKATVSNYFEFLDWLSETYGKPILVWGPTPTSPSKVTKTDMRFPRIGTVLERNYATMQFNRMAQRHAEARPGFAFATQFFELIDATGHSRPEAFYDNYHISKNVMRDAVDRARSAFKERGFAHLGEAFDPWSIAQVPRVKNIAAWTVPTIVDGDTRRRLQALPDRRSEVAVITAETGQSVLLDFQSFFRLYQLKLAQLGSAEARVTVEAFSDFESAPREPAWSVQGAISKEGRLNLALPDDKFVKYLVLRPDEGALDVCHLKVLAHTFEH
jgi:hypothetical protein